jgi:hypothetical protein
MSAAKKSAFELYSELANSGKIHPPHVTPMLSYPNMLESVPTITTYETLSVPLSLGTETDAELEDRTRTN